MSRKYYSLALTLLGFAAAPTAHGGGVPAPTGKQDSSPAQSTLGFPMDLATYTSVFPNGDGKAMIGNAYVRRTLQSLVPQRWAPRIIKTVWNESGIEHDGVWTYFSMCDASDCGSLNIVVFLNTSDQSMSVFTIDMSSLSTDQVLSLQKRGDQNLFLRYISCQTTGQDMQSIPDKFLDSMLEGNFLVDYNYRDSGNAVASLKKAGCQHTN